MTKTSLGDRRACTFGRVGIVLFVAVLVTACGNDDAKDGSSTSKRSAPLEREVAIPKMDEALVGSLGAIGTTATTAGCRMGSFDEQEPEHVTDVSRDDWNSSPPTSGKHFERWAAFGVYDEAIDDGYTVHNLEHGGVAVWYGPDVAPTMISAIDANIDDGEKWLMMPRKAIDGIASSAWTKSLTCDGDALAKLGDDDTASLLDAWFEQVNSTGAPAEKDIPAYAGGLEDPKPTRDVSVESPQFS